MHPLLTPFEEACEAHPDRRSACDPGASFTYAHLRAVAGGLARQIAANSDRAHVGVFMPTSSLAPAAMLGCWYAGRTPVPLNFMLAPVELGRVLQDAGLDLVVTIPLFAPQLASTGLRTLVLDPKNLPTAEQSAPAASGSACGALLYTSGTIGEPKGAILTFDNLIANVRASVAAAELTGEHVFLGLLPQFHAFGFTTTTLVPLLLGATVHYLPRFTPTAVLGMLSAQRVSVFITIASMYGALALSKEAGPQHFATLTHAVSGGEPLSARVAGVFEQRFGVRILEGYGMTEASPVVTLNTHAAFRLGTVGRPLPGLSVTAVDPLGRPLPPDRDGELVVRGHCVMAGYHQRPDTTAAVLRDGALWTGDVGRIDPDGFVTITGRAKEMIIVGGENVFPHEIESVLLEHPGVSEAAVIGLRDALRGEVPLAYVILTPGHAAPTEADLRAFCRTRLAAYKVPRQIRIATELPRGPTGKILKRALRAAPDAL